MEGRIKPSPVLNAPPAKESDPFCTSATLLPLRPCRRNTLQKGEFPLHSHPPRARRNAASNRAFSFSQCAISARDLASRASIWAWMSADVLPTSSIQGALRLGDRSLPSLSFLLLGGLFRAFGAPGLRHALLCATYSRSPTLSTFPLLPFDGLSNDRYRLRPSQRSQHLEWPLCATTGRSLDVSFLPIVLQKSQNATNFPLKDETSGNRRSMCSQSRHYATVGRRRSTSSRRSAIALRSPERCRSRHRWNSPSNSA